ARENAKRHAWAKAEYEAIVAEADRWAARGDDWYLRFLPGRDACYAYGFTGCPVCGAAIGYWWKARASFDRPGKVECASGHVLPDDAHLDPGTGYVAKDGRIHYLVGSFNAWVMERFVFGALNSLAYAWSLTGRAAYAEKAAFLLDRIAEIYPHSTKGSWDYPSNPPSGRLNRPWYQVARVLVHFADQYDQVYHAPALEKPSAVPGLTRRANIEENLLKNGAKYCHDQVRKLNTLNNGSADYVRGAMIVGVCLGIPEYIAPAVDGPLGIVSLLENNVDRDGKYYETSASYADHSRDLYLTFAEPLRNCRTAPYPDGYDVYRHPRFRALLTFSNLGLALNGQRPRYGDIGPMTGYSPIPERPFDEMDYRCLEMLYTRLDDPAAKREAGAVLNWLAGGDVARLRKEAPPLTSIDGGGFSHRTGLLFHAGGEPEKGARPAGDSPLLRQLTGSVAYGQKGLAILRRGEGERAQALLMRYGPSLNHGHRDDLNINYSARGYELTYDLGYGLATTHTQVGFARQTAAHNLVVVDETTQGEPDGGATGGSLHLFADLPGVQVAEASSENSYAHRGVDLYRRTVALIDGYLLDIFRVRGGGQHDYLFHALGDDCAFSGVAFGPEQPGSLAGREIDWCAAQLNDGDMKGHPNKPSWNPPPGNGYGFLSRPRFGPTTPFDAFSAEWTVRSAAAAADAAKAPPTVRLRLTVAPEPDTEALTALAPGIVSALPRTRVVGARRRRKSPADADALESAFVAVAEPDADTKKGTRVERLTVTASSVPAAFAPVAVRVRRGDAEDIVYSAADHAPVRIEGTDVVVAARFAHVRREKGRLVSLSMVGGTELTSGGKTLRPKAVAARTAGKVVGIDYARATVTLDAVLPTDGSLTGRVLTFSNPLWNRNTAYTIRAVASDGNSSRVTVEGTFDLGRGVVAEVPDGKSLRSRVPHEFARSVRRRSDSGFFTGKVVRPEKNGGGGRETRVTGIEDGPGGLTVRVDDSAAFRPGDVFRYFDVTEGDAFEVLSAATLRV
ncbi:MAG TPA: heparinase II/III family protein, partial [Armatimonadaceae bacterium]|nr:heparinase II/III family protein [Armatimonadaceae bacterium]